MLKIEDPRHPSYVKYAFRSLQTRLWNGDPRSQAVLDPLHTYEQGAVLAALQNDAGLPTVGDDPAEGDGRNGVFMYVSSSVSIVIMTSAWTMMSDTIWRMGRPVSIPPLTRLEHNAVFVFAHGVVLLG